MPSWYVKVAASMPGQGTCKNQAVNAYGSGARYPCFSCSLPLSLPLPLSPFLLLFESPYKNKTYIFYFIQSHFWYVFQKSCYCIHSIDHLYKNFLYLLNHVLFLLQHLHDFIRFISSWGEVTAIATMWNLKWFQFSEKTEKSFLRL